MDRSNRNKAIMKNGVVGIVSQCLIMVLSFLSRSVFLEYIGEELLGINSTFASVLDALSLGELGFQSAIVFMLYKPLQEGNQNRINAIVNLLKTLYRYVGIFFIVASVAVLPLLKFILKGVTVTPQIYLFFLLQSSVSVVSYFLAYPRSLLYADQKEYLTKLVDMVIVSAFTIVNIVALIYVRSYTLFLVLRIVSVVCSNLVVFRYYRKQYPFVHKVSVDRALFREAWGNTKDIFLARIAGFLYKSIGNLVISAFISTVTVAFYGNYSIVLTSLRTTVESAMTSMIPIIGNSLASANTMEEKRVFFKQYSHVRYLIALVVVIPFVLLIDLFIGFWVGAEYVLSSAIKYLMAVDLYIHLVHTPTYEFITASGLFREERNIEIAGAVINVILSIIGVHLLGLPGVLLGTVVSQTVFWICRSNLVYKKCLNRAGTEHLKYWLREGAYGIVFVVCLLVCKLATDALCLSGVLGFLIGGVVCELIIFVFILVVLQGVPENRAVLRSAYKKIKKTNINE